MGHLALQTEKTGSTSPRWALKHATVHAHTVYSSLQPGWLPGDQGGFGGAEGAGGGDGDGGGGDGGGGEGEGGEGEGGGEGDGGEGGGGDGNAGPPLHTAR